MYVCLRLEYQTEILAILSVSDNSPENVVLRANNIKLINFILGVSSGVATIFSDNASTT